MEKFEEALTNSDHLKALKSTGGLASRLGFTSNAENYKQNGPRGFQQKFADEAEDYNDQVILQEKKQARLQADSLTEL